MQSWVLLGDRVRFLPLGYTDTFASAFAKHAHVSDTSSFFTARDIERDRPLSVVFRGNRGLAQRIAGCTLAAALPDSGIALVDAEWSGRASTEVGTPYVDELCAARFALAPPGFVNNESFRFYEALVCGALPVEVRIATTHLGQIPWRTGGSITEFSWTTGLRAAMAMAEDERRARVTSARSLIAGVVQRAARDIRLDLEDS
jgi:hypothetical protein